MAEVVPPYKDEDLQGEGVSKKDLVTFLQENASSQVCVVTYYCSSFVTSCGSYSLGLALKPVFNKRVIN
jgi:hypothetical protein